MAGFLRKVIETALDDYVQAARSSFPWVFFDRGLIDAATAIHALTGEPVLTTFSHSCRYHRRVFLAPPWPEIYVQDTERRHDMDAARVEFEQLQCAYPSLGYSVSLLPKVSVAQRADFVLNTLED